MNPIEREIFAVKKAPEWKAAAYRDGVALGRTHMDGGISTTCAVEPGGASLLKDAAWKARQVGLPADELIRRVSALHAERVDALPDLAVYPELRGERDLLLERYRGMADAGMTLELIALKESLGFWVSYLCRNQTGKIPHGGRLPPEQRERCRVVFAPETDAGPLHFKNVDDPLHTWRPQPEDVKTMPSPFTPLFFAGTGSGLQIDDDPPEIFPADAVGLAKRYCETVPEAEAFLVRYNYFWAGANLLIIDEAGHAVAVDKASRCRYAVRRPGPNGVIYINGMSSFDPEYQAYIEMRRAQYLRETGQKEDSPEGTYFKGAVAVLRNMTRRMAEFERCPTEAALYEHLCSRDPDGPLCRIGKQHHPDDPVRAATLVQRCCHMREQIMKWRQWRGETPVWEDEWKTVSYAANTGPGAKTFMKTTGIPVEKHQNREEIIWTDRHC